MQDSKKTLRKIFHDSAKDAKETFPDKLVNFVVLLDTQDTPIYASPEIADYLTRSVNVTKRAIKEVGNTMKAVNAIGIAYPFYPLGKNKRSKLIGLRDDPPGMNYPRSTPEMRALYVLDHEIGHHVVKNGRGQGMHLGESAADAFATLRHIQRYGKETDFFKFSAKAASITLGTSPIHYTSNVFEHVKKLSAEMDIESLSLTETAELAEEVARKNHNDYNTLNKITRAFGKAANVYYKTYGTKHIITEKLYAKDRKAYTLFAHETMKVLRDNANDDDILLAGQRFLNYPAMKRFIKKGAKYDPVLQEALDFLNLDMQFTPTKPAAPASRIERTVVVNSRRSSAPASR